VVKIRKKFCLTFDVEEFEEAKNISEEERYRISFEGTERIIKLLKEEGIKATFFTTAKFAIKYPKLVKEISEEHEVGSHGYAHSDEYKNLDEKTAYELIKKSKEEIEKITKKEIFGFRAPRMNIVDYGTLKKIGFMYDASLHPTYIPGRYNNFFKPRKIHTKNSMVIVPTSVTPLIRAPFTWYWLRNYGLGYAKTCTRLASMNNSYISIYLHSWEFTNLKWYDTERGIRKNTGEKIENMLKNYIRWCKKRYEFSTIKDMIKETRLQSG